MVKTHKMTDDLFSKMNELAPAGGRLLLSPEQIDRRVAEMAEEISASMRDDSPWLVLGVLRGAFIFMADLVRKLKRAVAMDFIQISSYRDDTKNSAIELVKAPTLNLRGRSLLLVDDILDTGNSMVWLVNYLDNQQVGCLRTCVLVDKPDCRQVKISADYVGFSLPPVFVVGYGLDAAQQYRQLPGIYQLPED